MKTLLLLVAGATLAACTTPPTPGGEPSRSQAVADAATTPLGDLNLVRGDIPPVLVAARHNPYGPPSAPGCGALGADIQALDAVLGADLDTPPPPDDPGLVERGSQVAVDALRGAAGGVVPFRGWVRKLSGAERYERGVAAAIAAGTVRRAYLKGLGQAQGCAAPRR